MASGLNGNERMLIGLNEIKLGVPVPYLSICILQNLVGTRRARDIVGMGEFYAAEEAFNMGLVDAVLPVDNVIAKAIERARLLGGMSQEAYRIMKQNRVEGIVQRILAKWEEKQ